MAATDDTIADVGRRGRPRSEETRKAILRATGELLLDQGMSSISMDAVAERAGASKATIYRWWPSKELLALDAVFSEWEADLPDDGPDTGSLPGDLLALVLPWARQIASKPWGRVIAGLLSGVQNDPEFGNEYRRRLLEPRREHAREILARAIQRGEIAADTDIETAVDLIYAPFYHRILHGHAPLTDDFVRTVVNYVVCATNVKIGQVS
jgi:AcrR family transcriptional regulator